MNTAISFIKKNTVMVIALLAAVITSFIVPPDEKYLDYFDYKTLACLFSVLAVVCALKNVQFFLYSRLQHSKKIPQYTALYSGAGMGHIHRLYADCK